MEKIRKFWFVLLLNLLILILGIYNIPSLLEKANLDKSTISYIKDQQKISINSIPIKSLTHLESVLDKYRIGDYVFIKIENIKVTYKTKLISHYNFSFVLSSIVSSLFFLFPGIFILLKIKDEQIAVLFNLMMLSVATLVLLTYGCLDYGFKIINILNRSIVQISYIYLGVLFLEFSFLFPFKNKYLSNYFNKINFGLIIFIIPLFILNYHYVSTNQPFIYNLYYKLNDFILKPFFGISFILVLLNLIISYKHNISSINKQKLLWTLLSVLWGPIIYFVLYQFPFLLNLDFAISETLMQYLIIISPISLFIGIYKYNLLDITLFFKRSFIYGLIISLIITLYTIILFIFSNFISNKPNNQLPYIISLILIAFIFQPLRNIILKFTNRYLFKIKYNVNNIIENYKKEISSILLNELTFKLLIDYLEKYLSPKSYVLISKIEEDFDFLYSKSTNFNNSMLIDFIKSININKFISPICKQNLFVDEIEYSIHNLEFLNNNLDLIFYNIINENGLYLILGKKSNNVLFTLDDVYFLNNLVKETNNHITKIEFNKNLLFKNEEIKKLRDLNELKSYFVSSVTHDLKTPLTSIKLLAELMVSYDTISKNDREKYLNLIITESDRLNRLVNNVLDFTKIEKGVKKFNFQIVNINKIVDDSIQSIINYLELKKFTLIYSKNTEELFVNADTDSINEIINNLIENAVKYSFEKKEISIKTTKIENNLIIEVSDSGIGISEENQKKIFEPYSRADDERIKSISGTGIGLSVVKNIVDAHNGKIEVISKINEGTTFKIYLKEYKNENLDS